MITVRYRMLKQRFKRVEKFKFNRNYTVLFLISYPINLHVF